jgi:hypothetical protein
VAPRSRRVVERELNLQASAFGGRDSGTERPETERSIE